MTDNTTESRIRGQVGKYQSSWEDLNYRHLCTEGVSTNGSSHSFSGGYAERYDYGGSGSDEGDFADVTTWSESVRATVALDTGGAGQVGTTALYVVQAQVYDEDSYEQLAGDEVRIGGRALTDVTNDDGSVWTTAVVSGAAGANVEVTPQAAGNISFTGMKLSKMVYISVASVPSGISGTFDANAIQSKLQLELSTNVFDGLPTGQGVRIMVHINSSYGGTLGWNSSKQTYVTRVVWGEVAAGDWEFSDREGNTTIDLINLEATFAGLDNFEGTQFWVNSLAHESIWLNAGHQHDKTIGETLFNAQPDGDIASGHVNATIQYKVSDWSHSTLRSAFGF